MTDERATGGRVGKINVIIPRDSVIPNRLLARDIHLRLLRGIYSVHRTWRIGRMTVILRVRKRDES